MKAAKPYVGEPDTLLVTGFSAGGFATSLLADDVIDRFPSAKNITVCVDSSLLLYDGWHGTATGLWQSPSVISDRLTGNNLVFDSLTALYNKRGDSVKILFDCSYRDDTLMQYQSYINTGNGHTIFLRTNSYLSLSTLENTEFFENKSATTELAV